MKTFTDETDEPNDGECTCVFHSEETCPNPLHRVLCEVTLDEFSQSGSVKEPMYVVALDGDAKTDVVIEDAKSDRSIDDVEPIFGEVYQVDNAPGFFQWVEPVVGIGISYNREYRWAYICEVMDDQEIRPRYVYVKRIRAGGVPLEVYCAHDETTVMQF